jgi:type I restriction enzyme S subunit
VDEQQAIVASIGIELGRIKSLVQKTQQSIELLAKRRFAIIDAAVTGQIDLRESA